jgi:hypothetical protein
MQTLLLLARTSMAAAITQRPTGRLDGRAGDVCVVVDNCTTGLDVGHLDGIGDGPPDMSRYGASRLASRLVEPCSLPYFLKYSNTLST